MFRFDTGALTHWPVFVLSPQLRVILADCVTMMGWPSTILSSRRRSLPCTELRAPYCLGLWSLCRAQQLQHESTEKLQKSQTALLHGCAMSPHSHGRHICCRTFTPTRCDFRSICGAYANNYVLFRFMTHPLAAQSFTNHGHNSPGCTLLGVCCRCTARASMITNIMVTYSLYGYPQIYLKLWYWQFHRPGV